MTRSSRRMFLRGAGAALSIPFLPSLARKAHAQSATAPVFVGVMSLQGTFRQNWEVDMSGETQVGPRAWRKPLNAVGGPISPTLGTRFDGVREKMTVFQGLDGTSPAGHSRCFAFTGSSHTELDNWGATPHHPYSIDAVLERAPEFYGDTPPAVRALRLAPARESEAFHGMSWWTDGSGTRTLPYERNAATAFSSIFSSIDPAEDRQGTRLRAMDAVLSDYRRVVNHSRLGAEDRVRLQNYADLVNDLSGRLQAAAPLTCIGPSLGAETTMAERYTNHIDILVAALACGATRIGMLFIPHYDDADSSGSVFHGWSHGLDYGAASGTDLMAQENMRVANGWIADRVSELVTKMDGVVLPDGNTLLDHAAVMWSNELGGAKHHTTFGTPVVVAGSAGGRLRTNAVYDFRTRPRVLWAGRNDFPPLGRPYNALLISIFKAMGVPQSSWQKQGPGFGDYSLLNHSMTNGAYSDYVGREAEALPDYTLVA